MPIEFLCLCFDAVYTQVHSHKFYVLSTYINNFKFIFTLVMRTFQDLIVIRIKDMLETCILCNVHQEKEPCGFR